MHRPAPRGGANVPILKLSRCGGRERPPYRARETAATNREIAAARTPAGWFGPLVKGGWLRRKPQTGGLFRSRQPFPKGCAGGYFAGGGRFRGRHFGAGQSLRPRLMARPPPFDKGGKLQGGACNQPGNHDLDVIANPCRGRFYIGPVCGGANVRGRIWNPPLQWFFQCCSQPGNHDPRVTANLCRGRCLHRPAPHGGANTPDGQPLPGAAFRGGAIPPTAPGGAATSL